MGGKRTGRPPLAEQREVFARLIGEGATIAAACRAAGVSASTGKRWRHGRVITMRDGRRVHYAPVVTTGGGDGRGGEPCGDQDGRGPEPCGEEHDRGWEPCGEEHGRYLCECERLGISDLRRARCGVRDIARRLGRNAGTVSREVRRNAEPGSGAYRPRAAHKMAVARRARPKTGKIAGDTALQAFIAGCLAKRWSPEQISRRALPGQFPGEAARQVVHETIYQGIYCGVLPRELAGEGDEPGEKPSRVLRTGRGRRQPRRRDRERRGRIPDMTPLSERPAAAADRSEPGHWEGDLITGKQNKPAIVTLVDRFSRFTVLLHLPGRHTAEAVRDAITAWSATLPPRLRRSLTWDQGSEMSEHKAVFAATGMPVYFCDPHSPWQRPSNENTNGLLRQYFPKGTDLSVHSPQKLDEVAAELNARPRKTLGWDTPAGRLGR
jgi:transposase, IS30 family